MIRIKWPSTLLNSMRRSKEVLDRGVTNVFCRRHYPPPWQRQSLFDKSTHFSPCCTLSCERFGHRSWATPCCRPLQRPSARHWRCLGKGGIEGERVKSEGMQPPPPTKKLASLWPDWRSSKLIFGHPDWVIHLSDCAAIGGDTIGQHQSAN